MSSYYRDTTLANNFFPPRNNSWSLLHGDCLLRFISELNIFWSEMHHFKTSLLKINLQLFISIQTVPEVFFTYILIFKFTIVTSWRKCGLSHKFEQLKCKSPEKWQLWQFAHYILEKLCMVSVKFIRFARIRRPFWPHIEIVKWKDCGFMYNVWRTKTCNKFYGNFLSQETKRHAMLSNTLQFLPQIYG